MSDTIERTNIAHLAAVAVLPRQKDGWHTDSLPAELVAAAEPAPIVAVLIPCFNEEASVGQVVADFQAALPSATVYVYDNNSTDRTALAARAAGAIVRHEGLQGKGHVVRRMFADIDADAYVLVDGDGTYDATAAPAMLRLLRDHNLDMVNAARVPVAKQAYRPGHRFGNAMLTGMVKTVFGNRIGDMLSGYRVFSRRFVKSFPALATRFETETEFTVHALALHMPVREVLTVYKARPPGSVSKLSTIRDGIRILRTIVALIEQERPLQCFALMALAFAVGGVGLGLPVVADFLHTGLVPRLPTAVLATGLMLLSFLSLVCGLVLDSVSRGRKEFKRLAYLAIAAAEARR